VGFPFRPFLRLFLRPFLSVSSDYGAIAITLQVTGTGGILPGDVKGDNQINGLDVDPFVAAVLGGAAQQVPEPSALALAALGWLLLSGPWRGSFNRDPERGCRDGRCHR
jgi:hypothetical protein